MALPELSVDTLAEISFIDTSRQPVTLFSPYFIHSEWLEKTARERLGRGATHEEYDEMRNITREEGLNTMIRVLKGSEESQGFPSCYQLLQLVYTYSTNSTLTYQGFKQRIEKSTPGDASMIITDIQHSLTCLNNAWEKLVNDFEEFGMREWFQNLIVSAEKHAEHALEIMPHEVKDLEQ